MIGMKVYPRYLARDREDFEKIVESYSLFLKYFTPVSVEKEVTLLVYGGYDVGKETIFINPNEKEFLEGLKLNNERGSKLINLVTSERGAKINIDKQQFKLYYHHQEQEL